MTLKIDRDWWIAALIYVAILGLCLLSMAGCAIGTEELENSQRVRAIRGPASFSLTPLKGPYGVEGPGMYGTVEGGGWVFFGPVAGLGEDGQDLPFDAPPTPVSVTVTAGDDEEAEAEAEPRAPPE